MELDPERITITLHTGDPPAQNDRNAITWTPIDAPPVTHRSVVLVPVGTEWVGGEIWDYDEDAAQLVLAREHRAAACRARRR